MNLGGDPERDDFGLPPVDIEIPDDARELDRDVQAYHRELRAQRRRLRARRLHRPLTRDGMVLPLLAGCLVLALISGTLLTLFSAGQADMPGLPGRAAARPATTGNAAAGGGAGQYHCHRAAAAALAVQRRRQRRGCPLSGALRWRGLGGHRPGRSCRGHRPDRRAAARRTLVIAGRATRLRSLPPAVLALIPAGCQCLTALRQLVKQAGVGAGGAVLRRNRRGGTVRRLATQAGQHPARVAVDVA